VNNTLLHAPIEKHSILAVSSYLPDAGPSICPGRTEVRQLLMAHAGSHRWLLISSVAIIATIAGRDSSRAQMSDGTDLSMSWSIPKY
jgi:hypothetical protein